MEERRDPLRRFPVALGGLLVCAGAAGCELPPGARVENDRVAISYRTAPARIEVGKPFVLELSACPKKGALDAARVRMDASMPEHRHGMNYRVRVEPLAAARFRSEGWLFHMPGRWEFVFELGGERLTHSVRIE